MSVYSNLTEEDLLSLEKLAEQQKNEKARKIQKRIFKQTYDQKLSETFEPITKKIDKVVEATKELESSNVVNNFMLESPPGVTMSRELFATVGKMVNARNEFKLDQKRGGRYMFNGVNVDPMGGNNVKIGNNTYEITPEIQEALTKTSYNFY